MANENTGADSIRWYLSGAVADGRGQNDPDMALGNYRSSRALEVLRVRRLSPIRGITINRALGENGPGEGSLAVLDATTLAWTAPGDTAGTGVAVANGETKLLESANKSKGLVVTRSTANALFGAETVELSEIFNNAVGFDNVLDAEAAAGGLNYRGLFSKIEAATAVDLLKVWLGQLGTQQVSDAAQLPGAGGGQLGTNGSFVDWGQTGFAHITDAADVYVETSYYSSRTDSTLTIPASGRAVVGTAAAGSATDKVYCVSGARIAKEAPSGGKLTDQTGSGETTQPPGLTWVTPITQAAGVSIGTLAASATYGLRIERIAVAGMVGSPDQTVKLHYGFDDQIPASFIGTLVGKFRVENDALEVIEFYKGVGGAPDFTAAPWDTVSGVKDGAGQFTALPFSPASVLTVGQEHHFVMRLRNREDLLSRNIDTLNGALPNTVIDLDGSGDQNAVKPSAPSDVTVTAALDGAVSVTALYHPLQDGTNAADTWVIYGTFDGTTPDPDVDAPLATVSMAVGGSIGLEALSWTSAVQLDNAPAQIVVRTRRAGTPNVDSDNTTVVTATTSTVGPPRLTGTLFFSRFTSARPGVLAPPSSPADDFVIDAGNNIRMEPGEGTVSFYGDTVLIWRVISDSSTPGTSYLYLPKDWAVFDEVTGVGVGGTADDIEVISWTGPDKRLGVNVAGTRRMLIDVTNKTIFYAGLNQIDALGTYEVAQLVAGRFTEVRFMIWDPGAERWTSWSYVDSAGEWRMNLWYDQTLTQAEIEAL